MMTNLDRVRPGERVLCAVSGGADSMYLLCNLLEQGRARGFSVLCAHFNHRLRGTESDRDERFVREFCAARGVACFVGAGDTAAVRGMGPEAAARELRYAFLERTAAEQDCAWIATAHTADDNAETMLLQLARGSGLRGLCGIPPVRGKLLRPMLRTTRGEVEAWLDANGISYVRDSTNDADDYARNRVRHGAMPVLREVNAAFVRHAAQAAALLREDEDYLTSLAEDFLRGQDAQAGVSTAALLALPRPVRARVFRTLAGRGLSQTHIEALHRLCSGTEAATLDLPGGLRATREQGRLRFGAAASLPWPETAIAPGETISHPEQGLTITLGVPETVKEIHNTLTTFYFKYTSICGKLTIMPRKTGDRIRLAGRGCTKRLSALFAERGLTRAERDAVPVLRDEAGPVAGFGFGVAERCAARPGDVAVRAELRRTEETWI